ncbi:MAG TPA: hypothetical protein VMS17_00200, partial [Gemmataceae bacterium]|nr:hypothetical protein [Gemmataceae bacterium]
GDDAEYDSLFIRLDELGFEPLGARQEIGWFANQHWYKEYPPGRVFGSRTGDCFATLFRIFESQPWRLSFHTVFTDGSLVSTANQMPNFCVDMPGYYRWGHVTPDLRELLAMHGETAEDFRAQHSLTIESPDLEGACAAVARHSERFLRSRGPALGLQGLMAPLMIGFMLTVVIGFNFGFGGWSLPAACVLAGIAYRLLLRSAVRESAQKSLDADRERGLVEHWRRRRNAQWRAAQPTSSEIQRWDDDGLTDDPRRRR